MCHPPGLFCQVCLVDCRCIGNFKNHLRSKEHRQKKADLFHKEVFRGKVYLKHIDILGECPKHPLLGLSLVTLCMGSKDGSVFYLCHVCEDSVSDISEHLDSTEHCLDYYSYTNPDVLRYSWISSPKIHTMVDLALHRNVTKNWEQHTGTLQVLDLPPDLFETVKGTSYVKAMDTLGQNDDLLKQTSAARPKKMTIQTYLETPNRKHPLLGLEHLVECSCEKQTDRRLYLCTVCKLTFTDHKIINHLLSFHHIHCYINAWHPSTLLSSYYYTASFRSMMQDLAKQMEDIHGTTITDMKKVVLRPALMFSSLEGASYAKALEMLEYWRDIHKESTLTTIITPGCPLDTERPKAETSSQKGHKARHCPYSAANHPVMCCVLRCQVCSVTFEAASQYFAHVKGWDHVQKMKNIFVTEEDEEEYEPVFYSSILKECQYIQSKRADRLPVIGLLHIVTCVSTRAYCKPLCICMVCNYAFPDSKFRSHLNHPRHIKLTLMHQSPARLPFAWKEELCKEVLRSLAWEEENAQGPEHMVLKIIDLPSWMILEMHSHDYHRACKMLDEYLRFDWTYEVPKIVTLDDRQSCHKYPQLGLQFLVRYRCERMRWRWRSLCLLCKRFLNEVEFSSHVFSFEHVKTFLHYGHPGSLDSKAMKSPSKMLDLAKQAAKIHPTGCIQSGTLSISIWTKTYGKAVKILRRSKKMDGQGELIPVLPVGAKLVPTENLKKVDDGFWSDTSPKMTKMKVKDHTPQPIPVGKEAVSEKDSRAHKPDEKKCPTRNTSVEHRAETLKQEDHATGVAVKLTGGGLSFESRDKARKRKRDEEAGTEKGATSKDAMAIVGGDLLNTEMKRREHTRPDAGGKRQRLCGVQERSDCEKTRNTSKAGVRAGEISSMSQTVETNTQHGVIRKGKRYGTADLDLSPDMHQLDMMELLDPSTLRGIVSRTTANSKPTAAKTHTTSTTCKTTDERSKTGHIQTYVRSNSDLSRATSVSPASACGSSSAETPESTRRSESTTHGPAVGSNFLVAVTLGEKRCALFCLLCKTRPSSYQHRFRTLHRKNYVRFKRPELTESGLSETELQTIVTELSKQDTGGRIQTMPMNSEREYEELTYADVPEVLIKIRAILRQQRGSQDSPSATDPQPESLQHQDMSAGLHKPSHHPDGNKTNQRPDRSATGSESSPLHTLPTDTQPEGPPSCDDQLESSEDPRTRPVAPGTRQQALHDSRTQSRSPHGSRTQPVARRDIGAQPGAPEDSVKQQGICEDSKEWHHVLQNPDTRQEAPQCSSTRLWSPQYSGTRQNAPQVITSSPSLPAGIKTDSRLSRYLKAKSDADGKRVVGLKSLLECQCRETSQRDRVFPFYMCRCCQETVQPQHIYEHVISTDHQINYMCEKYPNIMAGIRNLEDVGEEQKRKGIKLAINKVAEREAFFQTDVEVRLLDKNSYDRVQAASFNEGIHILEDLWRQQNETSSCPPADQQPPEMTDNKGSVRLKKSLIETIPINLSIVKTEPITEPLSTLNTHNSNTKVTIKQEVKQEDHANPCFSGHTEKRQTVKRVLDDVSSNGETVKWQRMSMFPDGGDTHDRPSGPYSDISSPDSQCSSPPQNQMARVNAETTVSSAHLEPSQMQPRPKLERILKSLKTLVSSNCSLECSATKPASAASTEPPNTPSFIGSSLAEHESRPVLRSTFSEVTKASPSLTLTSVTAVPLSPPVADVPLSPPDNKELPAREQRTSIFDMDFRQLASFMLTKQSGTDVSHSRASPENAAEITNVVIGDVQSLENHCRAAANPAGEDSPVPSNPPAAKAIGSTELQPRGDHQPIQLYCNLSISVGEPSATPACTVINPNAAPALASTYNTMASPFSFRVGPNTGSPMTVLNPNPTSQRFTGSDYRINQPTISTGSPCNSLAAAGYGTPVCPYSQVTHNPYFQHGYPYGTGAQNPYFTHGYPYGTGPAIITQAPDQHSVFSQYVDYSYGSSGGSILQSILEDTTTYPTAEAWLDMQKQQPQ